MKQIFLSLLSFQFLTSIANEKPNVLLIISDDHGKDALGCYGNPVIKTPALDALADEGVRFTNAFCTSASCTASRSVILTGKFNHATGAYGHMHSYHHFRTFKEEKSLPYYMEKGGYRTGRVGKFHVAPEEVYQFQYAFNASPRSPVEMANVCKDFIYEEGEPFFLFYCTADPHRGKQFENLPYKPNSFGNKESGGYPGIDEQHYSSEEVIVPDFLPDTPECRAELAQYYQSVSRVDQGVKRLVEILKEFGKYDNTIIIYISDNGVAFHGAKTTLYEPGMNLPCIIKLQGQRQASIINDNLISWVDLTPTILDMAGLYPKENTFHGKSFKNIILNPEKEGAKAVYASHVFHEITMYYPMRVIREKKYKFIYNIAHELEYPSASDLWASPTWQSVYKKGESAYYGQRTINDYLHRPKFELYDIEKDPDEINNLAEKEEYQDLVSKFIIAMKEFQRKTDDPWILKWEYE